MIIIKLQGGLGNQLFQWAFGLSKQLKTNCDLKFDANSFASDKLRNLEITHLVDSIAIASKKEIKTTRFENGLLRLLVRKLTTLINPYYKRKVICEQSYLFDEALDSYTHNSNYFEGYWQNEKYFIDYRSQILKSIHFEINTSKKYQDYKSHILDKTKNSVAIHVRRGDYINDPNTFEVHGVCSLEYYKNAIQLMKEKYNDVHFYIFSNDLKWCENNFSFTEHKTYIKHTETVFEDLELMSLCKGQIIANSSLSWWSAWINQHPNKKIIAPKKWFNKTDIDYSQLVPKNWKKL